MTYIIKCLAGIHSTGDFEIRGGQEREVSKEIYDYFNNRFGSSGKFNFVTKEDAKKPAPKVEEVKEVTEEVAEEAPVEKKTRAKK